MDDSVVDHMKPWFVRCLEERGKVFLAGMRFRHCSAISGGDVAVGDGASGDWSKESGPSHVGSSQIAQIHCRCPLAYGRLQRSSARLRELFGGGKRESDGHHVYLVACFILPVVTRLRQEY